MNSLVYSSLNFRLCNLPHLTITQPYFQFRWIGILIRQNPLVSTLSAFSVALSSNFLRGSKGRYSSRFCKTFWRFFSSFFRTNSTPFNTLFRPAFQSGCKCTTFTFYIPNFWESFLKVFFSAFFEALNQSLPSLTQSPCFQSGCKSNPYFLTIQALLKKNLKIFLHQDLNSWMLKCGDFYKEYKVKPFLNEAQGGQVKKCRFFPKIYSIQKKRGRKAAPL